MALAQYVGERVPHNLGLGVAAEADQVRMRLPPPQPWLLGTLIDISACDAGQCEDAEGRRTRLMQVSCRQEGSSAPVACERVQLRFQSARRQPRER